MTAAVTTDPARALAAALWAAHDAAYLRARGELGARSLDDWRRVRLAAEALAVIHCAAEVHLDPRSRLSERTAAAQCLDVWSSVVEAAPLPEHADEAMAVVALRALGRHALERIAGGAT